MEPIEIQEYKGYIIEVFHDENPESPRNFDNLGTMVCFHKKYQLGDPHSYSKDELLDMVENDDYIAIPLYLYDHGGLTMNTGGFEHIDSLRWDWGLVGYILVSKEKVREEFRCKRIGKRIRQRVYKILEAEVEEYDAYLRGEVYGYRIIDSKGNGIDSCWGFYGDKKYALEYAQQEIDGILENQEHDNKKVMA